jgi:uncharacterized peroxidase-related enzyme
MENLMQNLKPLTIENAPAESRELLQNAKQKYGFVPNLLGNMAHAPTLLKAYLTLAGLFDETSLNPAERQIVLLATSVHHRCDYCVAAHTAIAGMQDVPKDVVEALRNGEPIADAKLQALRHFAEQVVETRGWPSDHSRQRFMDAGYTEAQVLEVLVGIGMKTLSNYTNHMAGTPLDEQFAPVAWHPAVKA